MSSLDLQQRLIQHHGNELDQQFSQILRPQSSQTPLHQPPMENQNAYSLFQIHQFNKELFTQPDQTCQHTNLQTLALPLNNKNKFINKDQGVRFQMRSLQESDDQTPVRKYLKHKKRKGNKQGYPTKNFLPNSKSPHLKYLRDKHELGADYVNSFQIIQIMDSKDGVSMKDYQTLYKVEQFQQVLSRFFQEKVLYRQLMLSRSSMKARKVHIKKLSVFQRAFAEKLFQRIN